MKTLIVKVRSGREPVIRKAATLIRHGQLVAFPTETVYGIGASAFNAQAVKRIFKVKGRPFDNPMIVHIGFKRDMRRVARDIPADAVILMRRFWPGPLTLIVPRHADIPDAVTAGLNTVAVRMPHHAVALALVRAAGVPIAAPSANRSGCPSPTTARHVVEDLGGRIPLILDGGPTRIGIESTVLDVSRRPFRILRPGFITEGDLRKVVGKVVVPREVSEKMEVAHPRSPGMKYRHYAPHARVVVVEGNRARVAAAIRAMAKQLFREHESFVIAGMQWFPGLPCLRYASIGLFTKHLFSDFRSFDAQGITTILIPGVAKRGSGLSLMNRIERSATIVTKVKGDKSWYSLP